MRGFCLFNDFINQIVDKNAKKVAIFGGSENWLCQQAEMSTKLCFDEFSSRNTKNSKLSEFICVLVCSENQV